MWRPASTIDFVPSEWESAVDDSDTLHIRYSRGELICQWGSYVAGIHLVLAGVVSEACSTSAVSTGRSDLLGAGDLIGIEMLADGSIETSSAAYAAVTDVELLFFERSAFNEQLQRNSSLSHRILQYLASRHIRQLGGVWRACSDSEALVHLLLRLDELGEESDRPEPAVLPEAIELRTLQSLSGLTGRRFRRAWDAIDTLDISDSQITFSRDALEQSAHLASDLRPAV